MLAQEKALVGRVNDDRVLGQPGVVEIIEQPADAFVDRRDAGQVVVHVALVFPADEIAAFEIELAEGCVARLVIGVPDFALLGVQIGRRAELEIVRVHRAADHHVLLVLGLAAAGIVVEQRVGLGKLLAVVKGQILQGRLPFAVRGLVLAHQQKRLRRVAAIASQSSVSSVMMSVT